MFNFVRDPANAESVEKINALMQAQGLPPLPRADECVFEEDSEDDEEDDDKSVDVPERMFDVGHPETWSEKFRENYDWNDTAKYDWFIDVYLLRLDDEFVHRGTERGAYIANISNDQVARDFWVFCELAVQHKMVPSDWDWKVFLEHCKDYVAFGREKKDVANTWDNVISHREIGNAIYSSPYEATKGHASETKLVKKAEAELFFEESEHFEQIGGLDAWKSLIEGMHRPPDVD